MGYSGSPGAQSHNLKFWKVSKENAIQIFSALMRLSFLYPQDSNRPVLLSLLPRTQKVTPCPCLWLAKPGFAVELPQCLPFCLDQDHFWASRVGFRKMKPAFYRNHFLRLSNLFFWGCYLGLSDQVMFQPWKGMHMNLSRTILFNY